MEAILCEYYMPMTIATHFYCHIIQILLYMYYCYAYILINKQLRKFNSHNG
jgi:hypothetical protein